MRFRYFLRALAVVSLTIAPSLMAATENTVEMVEKIESVTENPAGCPSCIARNAGEKPDAAAQAALMKSCIESICPSNSFSQAALDQAIAKKANDPQFEKEIAPLVNEIARETAKDRVGRAEILKAWIKDAKPLASENGIRAFNFFRALERVGQFEYASDGSNLRIDLAKSRSRFPQLSDDEFQRAVLIETRMLKSFTQRAIIETDPARIKLLYPGERYRAVVDGTIQQLRSLGVLIERSPDVNFLMSLDSIKSLSQPEFWRPYFADGKMNPDAITSMNNTVSTFQLLLASASEPEFRAALKSNPIDLQKLAADEKFTDDLTNQSEAAKKVAASNDVLDSPACRTAYASGQETYPNAADINTMRTGGAERIRNDFIKAIRGHLSKQSAAKVEITARAWKPIFPPSREQHLQTLKTQLQDRIKETKLAAERYQQTGKSKDRDLVFAMALATRATNTAAPTEKADDVCLNLIPRVVPDGALANGFIIGPTAFMKDGGGRGFASHEIAHLLFKELMTGTVSGETASWFDQSRQCLLANHTELNEEERGRHLSDYRRTGRSQYTEEDWVEGFGAVADGNQNGVCFAVRQDQTADYGALSMKNTVANDEHASLLQRALHVQFVQKGSLPEVCGEALRAKNESAKFKNCFTKTGTM